MEHSDYSELRRERSQNLETLQCLHLSDRILERESASNRIGIPLSMYLNCNRHRQRIKCSKSGKVIISKKL